MRLGESVRVGKLSCLVVGVLGAKGESGMGQDQDDMILMPLRTVPARCGELPTDRPVFVICASGNRSKTAADWMNSRGVDAYSVTGGTGAWARAGRPVAAGSHEHAA